MRRPGSHRRASRRALSLVSVDLARLAEEVTAAEAEVGSVHVCVMDGHFVPALTVGPAVLADLRQHTSLPLECHLMAEDIAALSADVAEAGADSCIFHVEASDQPARTAESIHELGMSVGVALRPDTRLAVLEPLIDLVDSVLLTGLHSGRSQAGSDLLRRVEQARLIIDSRSDSVELHVEGHMDRRMARGVTNAGADVLVPTQRPRVRSRLHA